MFLICTPPFCYAHTHTAHGWRFPVYHTVTFNTPALRCYPVTFGYGLRLRLVYVCTHILRWFAFARLPLWFYTPHCVYTVGYVYARTTLCRCVTLPVYVRCGLRFPVLRLHTDSFTAHLPFGSPPYVLPVTHLRVARLRLHVYPVHLHCGCVCVYARAFTRLRSGLFRYRFILVCPVWLRLHSYGFYSCIPFYFDFVTGFHGYTAAVCVYIPFRSVCSPLYVTFVVWVRLLPLRSVDYTPFDLPAILVGCHALHVTFVLTLLVPFVTGYVPTVDLRSPFVWIPVSRYRSLLVFFLRLRWLHTHTPVCHATRYLHLRLHTTRLRVYTLPTFVPHCCGSFTFVRIVPIAFYVHHVLLHYGRYVRFTVTFTFCVTVYAFHTVYLLVTFCARCGCLIYRLFYVCSLPLHVTVTTAFTHLPRSNCVYYIAFTTRSFYLRLR